MISTQDRPWRVSRIERRRELRQLIEAASGKRDVNDIYKDALHLATIDELTGLHNRRYFMMRLQEEIERGVRYNTPFSLIYLDLDDFKSVNDQHGHPIGDQVLREFSLLLQKELRSVDVVSRYGGEEFAVLLPECDVLPALLAAGRLRELVEAHEFTSSQLSLTVSIGVAAFPKHGNSAELLLDNLDKALLQAKEQGKNMVCESDWTGPDLTEKETVEPLAALKEQLQQLPEVVNVQIVRDEQKRLLFVHLLIRQVDDRDNRKLRERVVECGRESGVEISEEQVTLAVLERIQALEQNAEVRVALDTISTKVEMDMIEVEVTLDFRGRKYVGRHRGANRHPLRMRVVGEATLNALQPVSPQEFKLTLIGVRRVTVEETETMVALVTVLKSGREFRFVGTALNENGDEMRSAVKAVLGALNRFLARILST